MINTQLISPIKARYLTYRDLLEYTLSDAGYTQEDDIWPDYIHHKIMRKWNLNS